LEALALPTLQQLSSEIFACSSNHPGNQFQQNYHDHRVEAKKKGDTTREEEDGG
jgi:hypothetical protein